MDEIEMVSNEVRKSRPVMVSMGVVMLGMAIGGWFIPVEAGAAAWVPFAKLAILALFLGVGSMLVYMGMRPLEKHPVLILLRENPTSIVWAHIVKQRTNGVHTATSLNLYTDAGKNLMAPLPRTEEGEIRGIAMIRKLSPHATIGYAPEYEAKFKQNPASLRTSA